MSTTQISSDIAVGFITWLIVIPFIAAIFLDKYITDERRHYFRIFLYLISGVSSAIMGFEFYTSNITNSNIVSNAPMFAAVFGIWTIGTIVAFIFSLAELLGYGYDIDDGGLEV